MSKKGYFILTLVLSMLSVYLIVGTILNFGNYKASEALIMVACILIAISLTLLFFMKYRKKSAVIKDDVEHNEPEFKPWGSNPYGSNNQQSASYLLHRITSNSSKSYEVNEKEKTFIEAFVQLLHKEGIPLQEIYIKRMSDGTLNFTNNLAQFGRVKLQGRASKMQVLCGITGVRWHENKPLDFYIQQLPKWIEQVKYNRQGEQYNALKYL